MACFPVSLLTSNIDLRHAILLHSVHVVHVFHSSMNSQHIFHSEGAKSQLYTVNMKYSTICLCITIHSAKFIMHATGSTSWYKQVNCVVNEDTVLPCFFSRDGKQHVKTMNHAQLLNTHLLTNPASFSSVSKCPTLHGHITHSPQFLMYLSVSESVVHARPQHVSSAPQQTQISPSWMKSTTACRVIWDALSATASPPAFHWRV